MSEIKVKAAENSALSGFSISTVKHSQAQQIQSLIETTLKTSYLDAAFVEDHWLMEEIRVIKNPALEQRFRERAEELVASCGQVHRIPVFSCFRGETSLKSIIREGPKVKGSVVSYHILGDNAKGVTLCQHADLQLTAAKLKSGQSKCWLVVFAAVCGRVASVDCSVDGRNDQPPVPGYDCHISQTQPDNDSLILNQAVRSQMYFFDGAQDGGYRDNPRQCLPLAYIIYRPKTDGGSNVVTVTQQEVLKERKTVNSDEVVDLTGGDDDDYGQVVNACTDEESSDNPYNRLCQYLLSTSNASAIREIAIYHPRKQQQQTIASLLFGASNTIRIPQPGLSQRSSGTTSTSATSSPSVIRMPSRTSISIGSPLILTLPVSGSLASIRNNGNVASKMSQFIIPRRPMDSQTPLAPRLIRQVPMMLRSSSGFRPNASAAAVGQVTSVEAGPMINTISVGGIGSLSSNAVLRQQLQPGDGLTRIAVPPGSVVQPRQPVRLPNHVRLPQLTPVFRYVPVSNVSPASQNCTTTASAAPQNSMMGHLPYQMIFPRTNGGSTVIFASNVSQVASPPSTSNLGLANNSTITARTLDVPNVETMETENCNPGGAMFPSYRPIVIMPDGNDNDEDDKASEDKSRIEAETDADVKNKMNLKTEGDNLPRRRQSQTIILDADLELGRESFDGALYANEDLSAAADPYKVNDADDEGDLLEGNLRISDVISLCDVASSGDASSASNAASVRLLNEIWNQSGDESAHSVNPLPTSVPSSAESAFQHNTTLVPVSCADAVSICSASHETTSMTLSHLSDGKTGALPSSPMTCENQVKTVAELTSHVSTDEGSSNTEQQDSVIQLDSDSNDTGNMRESAPCEQGAAEEVPQISPTPDSNNRTPDKNPRKRCLKSTPNFVKSKRLRRSSSFGRNNKNRPSATVQQAESGVALKGSERETSVRKASAKKTKAVPVFRICKDGSIEIRMDVVSESDDDEVDAERRKGYNVRVELSKKIPRQEATIKSLEERLGTIQVTYLNNFDDTSREMNDRIRTLQKKTVEDDATADSEFIRNVEEITDDDEMNDVETEDSEKNKCAVGRVEQRPPSSVDVKEQDASSGDQCRNVSLKLAERTSARDTENEDMELEAPREAVEEERNAFSYETLSSDKSGQMTKGLSKNRNVLTEGGEQRPEVMSKPSLVSENEAKSPAINELRLDPAAADAALGTAMEDDVFSRSFAVGRSETAVVEKDVYDAEDDVILLDELSNDGSLDISLSRPQDEYKMEENVDWTSGERSESFQVNQQHGSPNEHKVIGRKPESAVENCEIVSLPQESPKNSNDTGNTMQAGPPLAKVTETGFEGYITEPISPARVTEAKPISPACVTEAISTAFVTEPISPAYVTEPISPAYITEPISPACVTEAISPASQKSASPRKTYYPTVEAVTPVTSPVAACERTSASGSPSSAADSSAKASVDPILYDDCLLNVDKTGQYGELVCADSTNPTAVASNGPSQAVPDDFDGVLAEEGRNNLRETEEVNENALSVVEQQTVVECDKPETRVVDHPRSVEERKSTRKISLEEYKRCKLKRDAKDKNPADTSVIQADALNADKNMSDRVEQISSDLNTAEGNQSSEISAVSSDMCLSDERSNYNSAGRMGYDYSWQTKQTYGLNANFGRGSFLGANNSLLLSRRDPRLQRWLRMSDTIRTNDDTSNDTSKATEMGGNIGTGVDLETNSRLSSETLKNSEETRRESSGGETEVEKENASSAKEKDFTSGGTLKNSGQVDFQPSVDDHAAKETARLPDGLSRACVEDADEESDGSAEQVLQIVTEDGDEEMEQASNADQVETDGKDKGRIVTDRIELKTSSDGQIVRDAADVSKEDVEADDSAEVSQQTTLQTHEEKKDTAEQEQELITHTADEEQELITRIAEKEQELITHTAEEEQALITQQQVNADAVQTERDDLEVGEQSGNQLLEASTVSELEENARENSIAAGLESVEIGDKVKEAKVSDGKNEDDWEEVGTLILGREAIEVSDDDGKESGEITSDSSDEFGDFQVTEQEAAGLNWSGLDQELCWNMLDSALSNGTTPSKYLRKAREDRKSLRRNKHKIADLTCDGAGDQLNSKLSEESSFEKTYGTSQRVKKSRRHHHRRKRGSKGKEQNASWIREDSELVRIDEDVDIPMSELGCAESFVIHLMKTFVDLPSESQDYIQSVVNTVICDNQDFIDNQVVYDTKTDEFTTDQRQTVVESNCSPLLALEVHLENLLNKAMAELEEIESSTGDDLDPIHHDLLVLTREMLFDHLNELKCYDKSRSVFVLPEDLRLARESGKYISVEGSNLFIAKCNLPMSRCNELYSLKVEIEEMEDELKTLAICAEDDIKETCCKLGVLHLKRKRCLDAICCSSGQLEMLKDHFMKDVEWFRNIKTILQSEEDGSSDGQEVALIRCVNGRIEKLEVYIEVAQLLCKTDFIWVIRDRSRKRKDSTTGNSHLILQKPTS